jgi:hypothetical protein
MRLQASRSCSSARGSAGTYTAGKCPLPCAGLFSTYLYKTLPFYKISCTWYPDLDAGAMSCRVVPLTRENLRAHCLTSSALATSVASSEYGSSSKGERARATSSEKRRSGRKRTWTAKSTAGRNKQWDRVVGTAEAAASEPTVEAEFDFVPTPHPIAVKRGGSRGSGMLRSAILRGATGSREGKRTSKGKGRALSTHCRPKPAGDD